MALQYKSPEQRKQNVIQNKNLGQQTRRRNARIREESKLNLKQKLKVYRKDGKFFVDVPAAFALKLVRRIVREDNIKYIELSEGKLKEIQNRGNIEIEYTDLDKEEETGEQEQDLDGLQETLGDLEYGKYGIGVHEIVGESIEEKQDIAKRIATNGLKMNNNSKTILSTSVSLGENEGSTEEIGEEVVRRIFSASGPRTLVVIASPLHIKNSQGEDVFLGFPEKNRKLSGQQYVEHCILDRICATLGHVPPEFILGYLRDNPDGTRTFERNMQHISNLNEKQIDELCQRLIEIIKKDSLVLPIHQLIANKDVEKLREMMGKMQERGLPSFLIESSIMLAQEVSEQKIEVTEDKIQESDKAKANRRHILLELYSNAKNPPTITSSHHARKILELGINPQEKGMQKTEDEVK